jgi:hypothetical protein
MGNTPGIFHEGSIRSITTKFQFGNDFTGQSEGSI